MYTYFGFQFIISTNDIQNIGELYLLTIFENAGRRVDDFSFIHFIF